MAADAARAVHLLCAGAAKGVVEALRDDFAVATGAPIDATFGAVGAIRALLDAGARDGAGQGREVGAAAVDGSVGRASA